MPEKPAYPLADLVELVSREIVIVPEFAGAAPGHVGMNAIRIRVPDDLPSGSIEIKVRLNGRESNTVLLPVEDPAQVSTSTSEM